MNMKPLSGKQRRFCEIHAQGIVAGKAYEKAGYKCRGDYAHQAASRLLSKNVNVRAYVEELRNQASEDCRWSKKNAMDYLCDILETPIGKIDKNHKLAQEYHEGSETTGSKIKMPAKLDALDKLCKITGWYEPDKIKVEAHLTTEEISERVKTVSPLIQARIAAAKKSAEENVARN